MHVLVVQCNLGISVRLSHKIQYCASCCSCMEVFHVRRPPQSQFSKHSPTVIKSQPRFHNVQLDPPPPTPILFEKSMHKQHTNGKAQEKLDCFLNNTRVLLLIGHSCFVFRKFALTRKCFSPKQSTEGESDQKWWSSRPHKLPAWLPCHIQPLLYSLHHKTDWIELVDPSICTARGGPFFLQEGQTHVSGREGGGGVLIYSLIWHLTLKKRTSFELELFFRCRIRRERKRDS